MGVSILPRFAAIVISVTTRLTERSMSARRSTKSPNGTKVISATSLVIHMLHKKHRNTSTNATPRPLLVLRSSPVPSF